MITLLTPPQALSFAQSEPTLALAHFSQVLPVRFLKDFLPAHYSNVHLVLSSNVQQSSIETRKRADSENADGSSWAVWDPPRAQPIHATVRDFSINCTRIGHPRPHAAIQMRDDSTKGPFMRQHGRVRLATGHHIMPRSLFTTSVQRASNQSASILLILST